METWIEVWTVSVYVGVGAFALMSLWVILAGVGDIRRMFADLSTQRDDAAEEDRTAG